MRRWTVTLAYRGAAGAIRDETFDVEAGYREQRLEGT